MSIGENAMKGKEKRTLLMILLAAISLSCGAMAIRQQLQYRKILADGEEAAQIAGLQGQSAEGRQTAAPLPSSYAGTEGSASLLPSSYAGTEGSASPLPSPYAGTEGSASLLPSPYAGTEGPASLLPSPYAGTEGPASLLPSPYAGTERPVSLLPFPYARAGGLVSPLPAHPAEAGQAPPSEALPEEAADLADIDLGALRAANEDVAGWIKIPGTALSYPLMQGTDNQFYLSHNWKGEASRGGSVFLEATSSPELTDLHTIVYGHRMRNGSMFATLKYYKTLDFWQEHPRVYIVLDDGVYRYDIFAAREAAVGGPVYRLDLEERGLGDAFIQDCIDGSVIDTGILPDTGDRLLTLSTCTGTGYATRWVVHAVLAQVY